MEGVSKSQDVQMKGRRVVLFPASFQGHITPMLQLANILHARGFSITIICTPLISLRSTHHPHFTFLHISDGISPEEAFGMDAIAQLYLQNTNYVEPFTECLGRIIRESPKEERVACLISDALLPSTQSVADVFELRRIVLRTGSASSFIPLAELCRLHRSGLLPLDASRSDEALPDLPPLRFKDLPAIDCREPDKFYNTFAGMISQTEASSGVIWNTFEELDEHVLSLVRRRIGIPCFSIGPLHKLSPRINASMLEEDASVIPWLDSQPPQSVVYVSFGSVAAIREKDFVEMAWGLVNSGHPFLLVVRSGLVLSSRNLTEQLPEGFEEGDGKIVKWAPQREVLAHAAIGAFCTHAGWNSTIESIAEGVPMICLPSFGDQKASARYVQEVWKIGVYVEKVVLDRESIESAIRRVMGGNEGQEIRARAARLKEKARLSLQPGGSSRLSLDKLIGYIMSF